MLTLLDGSFPKVPFVWICLCDGLDNGQRQLAFSKIIANVFARCIGTPIVEQIINNLECDAQSIAVVIQGLHLRLVHLRDHATHFGGGREQSRGFAAHDLQVDLFGCLQILRRRQLKHLTFGNGGRRVRQDIKHPQAAGFDHQLERPRKQVIPNQHARLVVPQKVRRRSAPALLAFVHHIVMQQCRSVNKLNRCCEFNMVTSSISAHARRSQSQHRAQPFAPGLNQMRCHFGDTWRVL